MRVTWGTELTRHAILLFAVVNAALFSALLPLWEGFDETFHYGYVESLWQTRSLPVFRQATLPYDVVSSFEFAPVSSVVRRAIPEAVPYHAWFALSATERESRRRQLDRVPADSRRMERGNYEAHQPPLAYLLLAPLDWSLSKLSLTSRLLVLRLVCGIGAAVLLFVGASRLCRVLEMPEPFASAALFAIFSSEMLYASSAHVANDWLAIGVSALLLAALAQFVQRPDRRTALEAGCWLAAGLLTKAYFAVFAIFAACLVVTLLWRRRVRIVEIVPAAVVVVLAAGPWYLRNLLLYGNVGGTPEAFDGIGIRQALAAATRIDWPATAGYLARASLWTGNNSFNSYSRSTLNVLLALLAVGIGAWCWRRRETRPAEWTMFGAVLLFLCAVLYEGCAMVADRPDQPVAGPSPWYTQVLLAPVMALVFLGLARWRRVGSAVAAAMVTIGAWIMVTTWTLKLFPMYSGGGSAAMRLQESWNWWTVEAAAHATDLSATALGAAGWLYAGLAVAVVITIGVWVMVGKRLLAADER